MVCHGQNSPNFNRATSSNSDNCYAATRSVYRRDRTIEECQQLVACDTLTPGGFYEVRAHTGQCQEITVDSPGLGWVVRPFISRPCVNKCSVFVRVVRGATGSSNPLSWPTITAPRTADDIVEEVLCCLKCSLPL